MTLPSNVKSKTSHKNTVSHYITKLSDTLVLRDYEVALCEICYPHSFDNIYSPINKIQFTSMAGTQLELTRYRRIPPAYYNSIEAIVEEINKLRPGSFKGELGFEKVASLAGRRRVKVVLFPSERLELHLTLATLLGFTTNKWETEGSADESRRWRFKAEKQGDINSLHYNMFVYSDICQPSLVGNNSYPLLRTVTIEGQEGQYIHKTFETGHYVKLLSAYLHQIDIKLTNDLGEPIRFAYGKVIVKLHFRKRSILA